MKKLLILSIIQLSNFQVGFAQWNSFININYNRPNCCSYSLTDVNFISESSGMCSFSHYYSPSSGTELVIRSTNDSGANWSTIWSDQEMGISSYAIHTVKSQNTFFHIRNWQGFTAIDITSNNGATWNASPNRAGGYYVDFSAIDTSNYFLLYDGYGAGKQFINKVSNGIAHLRIDSFYNEKAHLIFFPDTLTGYVAASTPQNTNTHLVLKSITGGTNWFNVFSDSLMNIKKMIFTSANIGYCVGDSGKIIKTINGGLNWQQLNTGTALNLKSIFFLNDTIGYVVGDSGLIIKTINGGNTWHQQIANTTTGFSKIFFVNDSVGFALADQILYKTNQNYLLNTLEVNPSMNDQLKIYPNPFSTQTTLQSSNFLLNATLTINNCYGQTVKQIRNISGQTVTFYRDNLQNGLYFVRLADGNKIYTDKFVIIGN